MLCARPVRTGATEFPCGQCLCCRVNKRREWTARLLLEMAQHRNTEWATLTYADQWLPRGGTLVPSHLSSWIRGVRQRVRRQEAAQLLRYFGVGEYGSKTQRPHYHVFVFGLMPWQRELCEAEWRFGHVYWAHDPQNSKIAEYTAGYTVKKEGKDVDELRGRHKEFSRMSLRPPIGAQAALAIGESIVANRYAAESVAIAGDAPAAVNFGGKLVPLGRTLRRYVRQGMGWSRDLPDFAKAEQLWLRQRLELDDRFVEERERRRAAGAQRVRVRQKLFAKQETI